MRKVEIEEEEILIVKQALCDYRDKLVTENQRYLGSDIEIANKILKKIKDELNK